MPIRLGAGQFTVQGGGVLDGDERIMGGVCGAARHGLGGVHLQRLPQLGAAAGCTHQQQAAPQTCQQAQGAEQGFGAQECLRLLPEAAGENDQQYAPQADPQGLVEYRPYQQQCGAQEQETEQAFHQVHPGTGFRQEATAHGDQQQQRHADPDAHHKQHQAAFNRVAALRDIQQGTGQRRGHARPNQQSGQRAKNACAHQAAAFAPTPGGFQTVTQGRGQLQFEKAEHRQRQHHEQRGKAAQQPGLLQQCLQVGAQQGCQHAQPGIHQRHADHIAAGHGKPASGRGTAAYHQPGQNRQHRQRARGKGQQQAQAEEQQQTPAQGALLQAGSQRLVLCLALGCNRLRATQVNGLALWRVAQPGIGAALPADLDLTAGACRDQQLNAVAIDLGCAKKLIAVFQPLRQLRGMRGLQPVELEALLIQIVRVGYFPLQTGFA